MIHSHSHKVNIVQTELGKADFTKVWIRKEIEVGSRVVPGSAKWISSGVQICEQQ